MGWMNDMLEYMSMDPIYRKWNQNLITFSLCYAFSENFILPLSHDEVVHGKHSLLDKMPGDYWRKFAGLRAFYGYWMSHPGKKLLFMGSEYGQFIEWKFDDSLDWHLLDYPMHKAMHEYVRELNAYYNTHKEFWQEDCDWSGFNWISCDDTDNSVIAFYRKGREDGALTVVLCNFTPEVRLNYRIGVPRAGAYVEVFNSDAERFGGSNVLNEGSLQSQNVACHGLGQSLELRLPPLSTIYLRLEAYTKIEEKPTEAAKMPSMRISTGDKEEKKAEKPAAAAVQAVAEPVEVAAEPVQVVAEPVEVSAESVQAVAEPVEVVAKPKRRAAKNASASTGTRKKTVRASRTKAAKAAQPAAEEPASEKIATKEPAASKTTAAKSAKAPKTTKAKRTKATASAAAPKTTKTKRTTRTTKTTKTKTTGRTAGAATRKRAVKSAAAK
jgi:hypothetical protein